MCNRLLGAHLSISGGPYRALHTARQLRINALQIFLKSNTRWEGRAYTKNDIEHFESERNKIHQLSLFAHGSYLINLAGEPLIRNKSISAAIDEVYRARMLAVPYLILHPGSHKGQGIAKGIRLIAASLDMILSATKNVIILLETTAGQGSTIGHSFGHLADIINYSSFKNRLGVCLDTCHLFTSGYDFTTEEGFRAMKNEICSTIGIYTIKCIHLNDSKNVCGSKLDRHEHIGKGKIGASGFDHFLSDEDLSHIPLILETPKEMDGHEDPLFADRRNLARVRGLLRNISHKNITC